VIGIGFVGKDQNVVVTYVAIHPVIMDQVDEVRRAEYLDCAVILV